MSTEMRTRNEERKLWVERWNRELYQLVKEAETFFGEPAQGMNGDVCEEALRTASFVMATELERHLRAEREAVS